MELHFNDKKMEADRFKNPLDGNRINSKDNAKNEPEMDVNADLNQPCFHTDGEPNQGIEGFDVVAFAEAMSEKTNAGDQSLAPPIDATLVQLYAAGRLDEKKRRAVEYLELRYPIWSDAVIKALSEFIANKN